MTRIRTRAQEDYCVLELTNSADVALIDEDMYGTLAAVPWHIHHSHGRKYVQRSFREGGRMTTTYLHRVVTGAVSGEVVIFRNRNPLDCRRSNLTIATRAQSQQRRKSWGKSGLRGVQLNPGGKYVASIRRDGVIYYLGQFDRAIEAAFAYDMKAEELYGELAVLNYPPGVERDAVLDREVERLLAEYDLRGDVE